MYNDDDGDNKKGRTYLTFDTVMLQQVQIINKLASKELTPGRWEMKANGDQVVWTYIEDGREAFVNAVKMLKQGLVGDDNPDIQSLLAVYNVNTQGIDINKISDEERENTIYLKLSVYNKIYTLLLKKLRVESQQEIIYVERYK